MSADGECYGVQNGQSGSGNVDRYCNHDWQRERRQNIQQWVEEYINVRPCRYVQVEMLNILSLVCLIEPEDAADLVLQSNRYDTN